MDKLVTGIGLIVLGSILLFIVSIVGGTIVWATWPHIHAMFPQAAAKGIIAQDLSWWDSVCVTWLFSVLIKSSSSSSSKNG